jgi:hypothetical protein
MSIPRRFSLTLALLCTAPLAACSDTATDTSGGSDTSTDTADTSTDTADTSTGDADSDTSSDSSGTDTESDTSGTDTGGDTRYDIPTIYFECNSDAECPPVAGSDQRCINNVCLIAATQPAALADDDSFEPLSSAPNVTCYESEEGFFSAGETGPEVAKVRGQVERFGSGSQPVNLCVSIYDETLLLPFLYLSECRLLEDDSDTDPFIKCFQLDACRCDAAFGESPPTEVTAMVDAAEAALAAAEADDTSIDSKDECYGFIGYCSAITDPAIKAACEQRLVDNGLATEPSPTLIFGHTISGPDPVEPDNTELGYFETTQEVPTNTRVAFKVSGRESRWRDTWEYGLFTASDLAVDGFVNIGANTVSDGAWRTIPPAVGLAGGIDDTHGAIAGTIRDCGDPTRVDADRPQRIVNATVGISFDGDSKLSYFNGNPNDTLPLPGRAATNTDGTYAAIDLPSGPNRISPIICKPGTTCSGADDFVQAGTRNVFQTPKSIIIATFEPIRYAPIR